MSDIKQVKVDNWGIYFLQRLKHFFNRTDYCDLTLQFQDNAQLKVHRLVLSACTEYFEILERTCEMYEDCLVMPDDLQADVVVPIVNFMYTGQLEFRMDLLDKLYQTSEIMNMPVLTKLLDSHRPKTKIVTPNYTVHPHKRTMKRVENPKEVIKNITPTEVITTTTVPNKRSYSKAFQKTTTVYRDKKIYLPVNKQPAVTNGVRTYREPSPIPLDQRFNKKVVLGDPRPTRYELPEELDTDNIFENSFCNISYTSQPLMVHPETRKQYSKRPKIVGEASKSKKFGASTVEIVECKKLTKAHDDILFEDSIPDRVTDETEMFPQSFVNVKSESLKDPNQLFDQILDRSDDTSKVTIDTKNIEIKSNKAGNLDHAKIISEVLKKYPHLVKSNKNIKLKILNTSNKNVKKQKISPTRASEKTILKTEKEEPDFTYETDVIDSKHAARLIALGAENIEGPWICLICGTPGKAMNFTSYYKFRRHLVEVHREKPVLNICEYCGQRSTKRNYLLHHMYTKHGVEPPPHYNFPKCNHCNYIALTEALLVKHKASHSEGKSFRCNVCPSAFNSSNQLLVHIQNTGHKYSAERKTNLQCIYCQKVFIRETNLYSHLKTSHRSDAIRDGIIDDSDDDTVKEDIKCVKNEPSNNEFEELDIQYQIQQRPDGNIHVVTRKQVEPTTNTRQKILNAGFETSIQAQKTKVVKNTFNTQNEYVQDVNISSVSDSPNEIVVIDNNEYIMRDNQLVPRRRKQISEEEFILSDSVQSITPTTSMEITNIHESNVHENIQQTNMLLKNSSNLAQSIPIYVSNEEEYKALMASNQPIIFDSGDSNKTLTVLTTPHASNLETTTIDLDNTQSSDMMIIQDEYPLNVSEAVPSDNSNIVVVYSHQVGDQNKQYQLLTTQGLGAQFVQSSAILTQNYETVTTTAPLMNAHVLDKQVEEVWHSNLHQIIDTEQIEITPVTGIQSIVETDQVQLTNTTESNSATESNITMNDLPPVELQTNITEPTNIDAIDNQCHNMVTEEVPTTENVDQSTHGDIEENVSSMSVDTEIPMEPPSNEAIDVAVTAVDAAPPTEDTAQPTGNVPENIIEPEETLIQESETIIQIEPVEIVQEPTKSTIDDFEEVQQQSEEINMDIQTSETENIQITTEEKTVSEEEIVSEPNNISDVANNAEQVLVTEDTAEKIQTLASEWSEEDSEINNHETAPQNVTDTQTIVQETNTETCEIEESIENIQQEVEKQMNEATSSDLESGVETNENANSSLDESGQEQENTEIIVNTDPAVTQEKISSLLNDWEDNDSQEDNNSVNENEPTASAQVVESTPVETNDAPTIEKLNPDKQDNIKSLVSDWDEDEEENKD